MPANPDELLKDRGGWKPLIQKLVREKGHKAHDHYHRPNPNATGKHDEYLDGKGNPTRDQSDPAHIYSPEGVWWHP